MTDFSPDRRGKKTCPGCCLRPNDYRVDAICDRALRHWSGDEALARAHAEEEFDQDMVWYEKIAVVTIMVAAMEAFAWGTHRYVMHGWGWGWHRSHHEPHDSLFEKNDLYAATFALFVIGLFIAGIRWEPLWWAALGITVYGGIYAFVHDMMVHQRFGMRWVPRHGYPKRLLQAHRLHHAVQGKEGGVSFGFLLAPAPVRLKRKLAERASL